MKRIFTLIAVIAACAGTAPAAPRTNTPPSRPAQRFLFVVDMSYSMARLDKQCRQAVFDLIYTGLYGQMRPGDTYGLWTFQEDVRAGQFPMQVWNPRQTLELASRAATFLKGQRHDKRTRMDAALGKVVALINTVKDVTVFVISDGDTPFAGTPLDDDINAAFAQRASARREARQPYVTTLLARNGQIVSGAVAIAGERILLIEPTPAQTAQAPAPPPATDTTNAPAPTSVQAAPAPAAVAPPLVTNTIAATPATPPPAPTQAAAPVTPPASSPPESPRPVVAAPAPAPTPAPLPTAQPIIMTNPAKATLANAATAAVESNAPAAVPRKVIEVRTVSAAPPAPPPQTAQAATNAAPATSPSATPGTVAAAPAPPPTPPPPANVPAVGPSNSPLASAASEPTNEPAAMPKALALLLAPLEPATHPTPVAARESTGTNTEVAVKPKPAPRPALAVGPVSAGAGLSARALFIIGGALLVLAVALAVLCLRRMRPARQPSFITRSMDWR
jgi:hypothetical protein